MRLTFPAALLLSLGACSKAPAPGAVLPPVPSPLLEAATSSTSVSPAGVVKLTWFVRAPQILRDHPTAFYCYIERRDGAGAWKVVKRQVIALHRRLEYEDADTRPRTIYEYRVTLASKDPTVAHLIGRVMPPVKVSTPGIWEIEFSNIEDYPDADPPKPGQAYVTIKKYDKKHGLVVWRKIQHEGEDLGVITVNGVADSKHSVPTTSGRTVVVDFRTGGRIKKVKLDKVVPYTYEVCTPALNRQSVLECPGSVTVSDIYRVDEVLYTDDEGKDMTFTKLAGRDPKPDKLCPEHGGPPPLKELSADERLAQREKEAEKMMDMADELWASEKSADKKESQKIYKELLSSFADLEIVKSRKAEITERSKKKL